jgi:iron(III) transport system substrate-binding protein
VIRCLRRILLCLVGVSAAVCAQPSAEQSGLIYLYQGTDREQRLVSAARREGVVSLYTSMQTPDSLPLAQAFEKKYGVKVSLWRASGEKVVQRALTEARGGRFEADVMETDGAQMEILYREKQLAPFYSPSLANIPATLVPSHRHYVPTRVSLYVLAYNTMLVPPGEVPNSYEDLLHPRWRGKLGLEAADVAWFAAVTKAMGREKGSDYFQRLAASGRAIRSGHTLLAELVASGEIVMVPDAHVQGVERLKKRGAPVGWKPLHPAFGQPSSVGLSRRAPHPHAALLFADFILSGEGQEIIKARDRVPSSRAVDSPLNKFDYALVDPVIVLDEWAEWEKRWSALFLKGQKIRRGTD